jgi:hypothetical protein
MEDMGTVCLEWCDGNKTLAVSHRRDYLQFSMKSLVLFLSCCVAFVTSGCVTGEKLSSVSLGMSPPEVEKLMGRPNSMDSRKDGAVSIIEYVYANRLMSGFSWDRADYAVIFRDQHVTSFGPRNIARDVNPMKNVSLQPLIDAQKENARNDAMVYSQLKAPTIDLPPGGLEMSNGYPNNQSSVKQTQQMPTGLGGVRTGRTQMGLDGTTYFEMKDVNGVIYWSNK